MQLQKLRLPSALALVAATGAIVAGCGSSSSSSGSAASNGAAANAADRAFVQQMIPHHMMAVQMAQTAQQQGTHPQIKALAASIITDQQAEIAQMTPVAKQLGVKPDAMPAAGGVAMPSGSGMAMGSGTPMSASMTADAKTLGMSAGDMGMSMDMSTLSGARPFDRDFVDMMIPHHQGAVRMARAELAKGQNSKLRALASRIIAAQDGEISEMNRWRQGWYGATSPAGGVPAA